jgi:hypothetical protein
MSVNITVTLDSTRVLPKVDEAGADTSGNNITYLGYAPTGTQDTDGNWKIIKMVKTGTVTTFQYINGDESILGVWANRTTLTFSR